MLKKIRNPYDYLDYHLLLNDDFHARAASNHRYSLRAYSRDLALSPGFLSDVLRGKKEIGPTTGGRLFETLGFNEEEVDYLRNLVVYQTSDDDFTRQQSYQLIQQRYTHTRFRDLPTQGGFMRSAEHFVVYGAIRRLTKVSQIHAIGSHLGIKPDRIIKVIADLANDGYVMISGEDLHVTDPSRVVKTDLQILTVLKQFSELLVKAIYDNGGINVPDRVGHAMVLGLDTESYRLATEAQRHFVHQVHRLSLQSKDVQHLMFLSDISFALDL